MLPHGGITQSRHPTFVISLENNVLKNIPDCFFSMIADAKTPCTGTISLLR